MADKFGLPESVLGKRFFEVAATAEATHAIAPAFIPIADGSGSAFSPLRMPAVANGLVWSRLGCFVEVARRQGNAHC